MCYKIKEIIKPNKEKWESNDIWIFFKWSSVQYSFDTDKNVSNNEIESYYL